MYVLNNRLYFVGDGNFLAAASRVPFSDHMVVGINTDPDR